MNDWNNMLQQTRAAITTYELAADSVRDIAQGQGYVVLCQGLPLAFDIDAGVAANLRIVAPQLATRFDLEEAVNVAGQVKNGNGAAGEVVHVRHAIASALANQRELLGLLLAHTDTPSDRQ